MKNVIRIKGYCNHFETSEDGVARVLRHTAVAVRMDGTAALNLILSQEGVNNISVDNLKEMYTIRITEGEYCPIIRFRHIKRKDGGFISYTYSVHDGCHDVKNVYDYDEILSLFSVSGYVSLKRERLPRCWSNHEISEHLTDLREKLESTTMETYDQNKDFFDRLLSIISLKFD